MKLGCLPLGGGGGGVRGFGEKKWGFYRGGGGGTWLKDVWEQNGEQNVGAWESNKNREKIARRKAS